MHPPIPSPVEVMRNFSAIPAASALTEKVKKPPQSSPALVSLVDI